MGDACPSQTPLPPWPGDIREHVPRDPTCSALLCQRLWVLSCLFPHGQKGEISLSSTSAADGHGTNPPNTGDGIWDGMSCGFANIFYQQGLGR